MRVVLGSSGGVGVMRVMMTAIMKMTVMHDDDKDGEDINDVDDNDGNDDEGDDLNDGDEDYVLIEWRWEGNEIRVSN